MTVIIPETKKKKYGEHIFETIQYFLLTLYLKTDYYPFLQMKNALRVSYGPVISVSLIAYLYSFQSSN